MSENLSEMLLSLDNEQRKKANDFILKYLQGTMSEGKIDLKGLRRKLTVTYWVIIILSIIMFIVGLALISVPFLSAFGSGGKELSSLISGGFGLADLTALFLFKPIERIHKLMGDMSQIVIALNSFQTQVGLRLMQMDSTNRDSIGQTAEFINTAAKDSIKTIQDYFESTQPS